MSKALAMACQVHPDLAPWLAANEEMVAYLEAVAEERRLRKQQKLPKRVKSPVELERERVLKSRWHEACRELALRGDVPLPLSELLDQVRQRVNEPPKRLGLGDRSEYHPYERLYVNVGVGQDSVAIVVLYLLGLLPAWVYQYSVTFVFADTLAEKVETTAYAEQVLIPFMGRYGHELLWLKPKTEDSPGSPYHTTGAGLEMGGLRETYMADKHPSFPMWSSRARCTSRHKQAVLARMREALRVEWCGHTAQQHTAKGYRDWVLVGIAAEETKRLEPTYDKNYQVVYPLFGMNLDRLACQEIIKAAHLPIPIKSGCTLCYATPMAERWWLSQVHPEIFAKDVALEAASIADRVSRGLKPNYMCFAQGYDMPLPQAVAQWKEDNPEVTVEQAAECLITMHYSRDDKPKKCCNANQLFFDLEGLDDDDDADEELVVVA